MFSFQHWFLPLFSGVFIVDCIYCLHECFFRCFYFTTDFTIVFRVFSFHQLSLPWLFFVRYFVFACCCSECYGFERAFFKLGRFLPYAPSRLWHNLLLSKPSWASSSASKVARPPTQVRNTVTAHLFVWTTQCSAEGISR